MKLGLNVWANVFQNPLSKQKQYLLHHKLVIKPDKRSKTSGRLPLWPDVLQAP